MVVDVTPQETVAPYGAKDHRLTVQEQVSIEELDLMQDALRELEHLSKLATADLTKRFGKLYRLVSHQY